MATTEQTAAEPAGEYATARERRGWYMYDWANSAFYTSVVVVFLGPYLTSVAKNAAVDGRVHPLGISMPPESFFPYLVALSVFLSAGVLLLTGAIADRSPRKKEMMAVAAFIGSAATVCMVFVTGDRYLLGGGLFIVANLAFGASIVVYHSFLPQIAAPDKRDSVSSIGWAIGYLGGGLLLALNLVAVFYHEELGVSRGDVARYGMVVAGLWWAGFTLIPLLALRNRPPLEGAITDGSRMASGLRQIWQTLRDMRAYPLTIAFLGVYLIYNDGIQTVITMAATFGEKELGMGQETLVLTILMVQILAFVGALSMGALAKRIGARRTIMISLVLWTVVLAAAYFLPAGRVVPFLLLGGFIGIVLGGSQALSRSLFSQLIPAGKEAEYFSVYELSDKGTSWLGPVIFGLAYQLTQSYRVAIISLVVFFAIGLIGLALVPVRRAIVAAGNTPPQVV